MLLKNMTGSNNSCYSVICLKMLYIVRYSRKEKLLTGRNRSQSFIRVDE